MRVLIETTKRAGGWEVRFLDPAARTMLAPARAMERCAAPHDRFPRPPAHQPSACAPAAHALCDDATGGSIADVYDSINRVDVPTGDIDRFGGYLSQCLLGENWAVLENQAGPGADIELEILIESGDPDLQRLWWEMMFVEKEPLGVQKKRKVAITRVIRPEKAMVQPPPLQLPLRVLFVVGSQIDDTLRPGAELIGLLHRVPVPDATFKSYQTAQLHVRLLPSAAWDEIESAARTFKPDVVHIVSHGQLDPGGNGTRLLLTTREPEDPADPGKKREKTGSPYPCSAQRLLELVSAGGAPPPVMIVNACHTAEVAENEGQDAADLAFTAELVRNGVAIALGMSGEVADRACQIFTLSFYQALLRGAAVSIAAAQGRRAALIDFPDDVHNVEWARPTLFLAEGVNPALRIAAAARNWSGIAELYRTLKTPDVLCDRFDCMDRYEDFRTSLPAPPGRSAAIAFVTKEPGGGLGKSRLLEEIAARSVLDNFIPVIVRNNKENPEAPQNHLEMALQISRAVEEARANFGLPPTPLTSTREFAYGLAGITPESGNLVKFGLQETDLDDFLRQNRTRGKPSELKLDRVLPLLHAECMALRDGLRAAGGPEPTVLLLLDDLHRYAGCVQDILPRMREFGLGRPEIPLPVVFTCYAAEEDRPLDDALRSRQDILKMPLNPFETDVEQRLACRQFVFSFWKQSISSRPRMKDMVDAFYESVQDYTSGRPKRFWLKEVEGVVNAHKKIKTLVPTNFEEMLSKWK